MKRRPLYETRQEQDGGVHVDLTPLIDVVFILLIFFLVSAVFTQTGVLAVKLPTSATTADNRQIVTPLIVQVHADGRISDATAKFVPNVDAWLKQQLASKTRAVVVRPDRACNAQTLIHVMELCSQAGASSISVEAEKKP